MKMHSKSHHLDSISYSIFERTCMGTLLCMIWEKQENIEGKVAWQSIFFLSLNDQADVPAKPSGNIFKKR